MIKSLAYLMKKINNYYIVENNNSRIKIIINSPITQLY